MVASYIMGQFVPLKYLFSSCLTAGTDLRLRLWTVAAGRIHAEGLLSLGSRFRCHGEDGLQKSPAEPEHGEPFLCMKILEEKKL